MFFLFKIKGCSYIKIFKNETIHKFEIMFYVCNFLILFYQVMTRSDCIVGFQTLRLLLNSMCSDEVVTSSYLEDVVIYEVNVLIFNYWTYIKMLLHLQINKNNSAVIHDVILLESFILDWRIWHKSKNLSGYILYANRKIFFFQTFYFQFKSTIK